MCSPRRSYPLASLKFFQRSEGLAQVAMKRRHSVRRALSAPSAQSQRLLSFFVPLSHPGKDSVSTLALLFHSHPTEPGYEVTTSSPRPSRYGNAGSKVYSVGHIPCQRQTLLRERLLPDCRPLTSSKLPGSAPTRFETIDKLQRCSQVFTRGG